MTKQIILLFFFAVFSFNQASAQCTPKAQYADSSSGVWPSIVENLPCAFADDPNGYNTSIDIKTITDTTISYLTFTFVATIRAIRIINVTGLPEGFSYAPNQPIWENGGTSPNLTPVQGCLNISASAQTVQQLSAAYPNGNDYNLKVYVDMQIDSVIPDNPLLKPIYGQWLSDINQDPLKPVEVNGYQIRIRSTTGPCFPVIMSVNEPTSATLTHVYPNPASDLTRINYKSNHGGSTRLDIYNATGALVESRSLNANPGENTLELQTSSFANGLYHFTLSTQSDLLHGSFIRSKE